MPEVSRFLGIVITMYYNDHDPPHFHAFYGEYEIRVVIENGEVLSGVFPRRAQKHVLEWARLHTSELKMNGTHARARQPLKTIEPLE